MLKERGQLVEGSLEVGARIYQHGHHHDSVMGKFGHVEDVCLNGNLLNGVDHVVERMGKRSHAVALQGHHEVGEQMALNLVIHLVGIVFHRVERIGERARTKLAGLDATAQVLSNLLAVLRLIPERLVIVEAFPSRHA